MAAVVIALRAALVAEPALRRVDPVSTSGPVRMAITTSARARRPGPGAQVTRTVLRPRARAVSSAPLTKGVTALAGLRLSVGSPAQAEAEEGPPGRRRGEGRAGALRRFRAVIAARSPGPSPAASPPRPGRRPRRG